MAEPEIRGGVHQGVWVGGGGASGRWLVADVLQRRAAAPGVGLPDAVRGLRGGTSQWVCGQHSRFAVLAPVLTTYPLAQQQQQKGLD